MYAIVDIAGQQFKVEKNKRVYIHRLEASEGSKVEFGNVLLIDNDGKVQVGTPSIDGAKVAAKVLAHVKGDKVIVFKKKRRKGYKKLNGHRQQFTQILIQGILGKGEKLSAEDTTAEVKKTSKPKKEVTGEVAETSVAEQKPAKKVTAKKSTEPKAEKETKKAPAKKTTKKTE